MRASSIPGSALPGILSARDHLETAVLLHFDDFLDRLVLERHKLVRLSFASSNIVTLLNEFLRSQQGADVLSAERWTSLKV
jgi:hypothetical protein